MRIFCGSGVHVGTSTHGSSKCEAEGPLQVCMLPQYSWPTCSCNTPTVPCPAHHVLRCPVLCGVLQMLLQAWASDYTCHDKVLLFSHSTRCLDLLEVML